MATKTKKTTAAVEQNTAAVAKPYEIWEVKVIKNEKGFAVAEKLKKIRGVNISDEEAKVLNHGILGGNNLYAQMYFKTDSDEEEITNQDDDQE